MITINNKISYRIIFSMVFISIHCTIFSQDKVASKITIKSLGTIAEIKKTLLSAKKNTDFSKLIKAIGVTWGASSDEKIYRISKEYTIDTLENPISKKKQAYISFWCKEQDYYIQEISISKNFEIICFSHYYGQERTFHSIDKENIDSQSELYRDIVTDSLKYCQSILIPVNVTVEQTAKFEFEKGTSYVNKGKYDEAINYFNSAINYYPNYYEAYLELAKSYQASKNVSSAMIAFTETIKLSPKESSGYYFRGSYKLELNDYVGAISDFTKAISINPNYYGALLYRSFAKYKTNDYNGALIDCNKILAKSEDDKAYLLRGIIKLELKNKDGACSDFSKAGEMGLADAYEKIKLYCK